MQNIGVFDSGVGGLTVLKALRQNFPQENFVYLADTARLPYGSKSMTTVSQYVEQNLRLLRQYDVKAVVIACNTASTAVLERPIQIDIPVFNVVEPGARTAVKISQSHRIGVLGTRATVQSDAYTKAIRKLHPEALVFQTACPLFVPLVEEGWIDDPITNLIAFRYIQSVIRQKIDTLILGCTHYPALRAAIAKAAGSGVELVDSARGLVEDLKTLSLKAHGPEGELHILATDYSPRLEETIHLLLGDQTFTLETVDING